MNGIILADRDAIFRAGVARVLSAEEDMRIVSECEELDQMYKSVEDFQGSTVLFASSLQPDWTTLRTLLEKTGSRAIVIAEDDDCVWPYLEQGFAAVVYRYTSAPSLLKSVREVVKGTTCIPVPIIRIDSALEYPTEMRIHARIRFNHITFPAFNTKRNAC